MFENYKNGKPKLVRDLALKGLIAFLLKLLFFLIREKQWEQRAINLDFVVKLFTKSINKAVVLMAVFKI